MAVWAMMETPKGILRAEGSGGSHPATHLVHHGHQRSGEGHARSPHADAPADDHGAGPRMLPPRAHGLTILDGVYNDIQAAEGFRAVCQQGLEMGFDGKTLIHPSQVEPCNEVFAPSAAELEMAGKIVTAFKAAQAEGKGVVTVDGRMIREPSRRAGRARVGARHRDQELQAGS
jgi:citrate lyase subunit beta/citryl-CoA lyase